MSVRTISAEISSQYPTVSIKFYGQNVPRETVSKLRVVCSDGAKEFTLEEAGHEIEALNDTLQYEKVWTDHLREMHNQDHEKISELYDRLAVAERSIRELAALIEGIKAAL